MKEAPKRERERFISNEKKYGEATKRRKRTRRENENELDFM